MGFGTQDPRKRIGQMIAFFCILAVTGLILSPALVPMLPFCVPPWTAMQAKKRAPLVRVGMTDAQVWSTLGLTRFGFQAHVNGSGPPNAYPANYVLWPGYVLHMRWNLRTTPATLVHFQFRDRL
jgi:hypothetical protein